MVNDDRFIDDTLKSDDLQEDTFNEDHNSMFSGDEQMKRSSARKHRMVPDAGKGILWTLTGLALAACGGGGTVTGGTTLPGEPTGLPEEGLAVLSFDQARELGGAGPSGASASSTSSFVRDFGDIPLSSRGSFEINEIQLQPNQIIVARVGGAMNAATGQQVTGGGADEQDNYVGPVWFGLPGETLISPITDRIARAYIAEEDRLGDAFDEDVFYAEQIAAMFGENSGITKENLIDDSLYMLSPESVAIDRSLPNIISRKAVEIHLENINTITASDDDDTRKAEVQEVWLQGQGQAVMRMVIPLAISKILPAQLMMIR